jgi:hypothetical protein
MRSLTKLHAAETASTTPIMTLYYDTADANFNLQKYLFNSVGLWTVDCSTYDVLEQKAVRLMLPKTTEINKLISLLEKAQNALP